MVYLIITEFWRKEGSIMDLVEQLEWSNWKTLNDFEKIRLFEQVKVHFIPPTIDVSSVELVTFELCGIKCRTFELEIDQELFVFIPGNQQAILGWDLGAEGLRYHELLGFDMNQSSKDAYTTHLTSAELQELSEGLVEEDVSAMESLEGISTYINCQTSPLRRVAIPAMLVQKHALPAGTRFLGILDTITGSFEGDIETFFLYEAQIKQILCPALSAEDSLTWTHPETYVEKNQFYLEALPESDQYFVYRFQDYTYVELQCALQSEGFTLLTQDQWEYAIGAGTRRLFRWGNELLIRENDSGRQLLGKICGPNMFGLLIDTTQHSYELTNRPDQCKLSQQGKNKGTLIEQRLPLSSYYCNSHQISVDQSLDPTTYTVRRAILIQR